MKIGGQVKIAAEGKHRMVTTPPEGGKTSASMFYPLSFGDVVAFVVFVFIGKKESQGNRKKG